MFLKQIELTNLRGIRHLELSFDRRDGTPRQWTLILGRNGTGKSTLLRAIGLVTAGSNALTDLIGDPKSWVRVNEPSCPIRAVVQTKSEQSRELTLEIAKDDTVSSVIKRNEQGLAALDDALEQ